MENVFVVYGFNMNSYTHYVDDIFESEKLAQQRCAQLDKMNQDFEDEELDDYEKAYYAEWEVKNEL